MRKSGIATWSSILILAAAAFHVKADDSLLPIIRKAASDGLLAFQLTGPDEVLALLGPPSSSEDKPDGGMMIRRMSYENIFFIFGKTMEGSNPFTLRWIQAGEEPIDIGRDRMIVFRTIDDLGKIDSFTGLSNVSLARLDLRDKAGELNRYDFDTRTEWPPAEKMPPGFTPAVWLESSLSPGLGIGELHRLGIDGRGVGVAVIDQPLLTGHEEYSGRLALYDSGGLDDFDPAMHASAVASILVGRRIGVAPAASLTFFAVPVWANDNIVYVRAINRILELNASLPAGERIRVVSISDGAFASCAHRLEWNDALWAAETAGIMIVTCDRSLHPFGILSLDPGTPADDRANYKPGRYSSKDDLIRVPGSNRGLASHRGNDVYTFYREGGMSWGAPYIAGLAALAFQVHPEATPGMIWQTLVSTAASTAAGPIVDPEAFIESIEAAARHD